MGPGASSTKPTLKPAANTATQPSLRRYWVLGGVALIGLYAVTRDRTSELPSRSPAATQTQSFNLETFSGGQYLGKIDGKYEIRLDIRRSGNSIEGSYIYTAFNNPVRVSGSV